MWVTEKTVYTLFMDGWYSFHSFILSLLSEENHHCSFSLMLDVFLTFRLHPGAFGWGRLLTEEVVLSGYKVPPGVSTTEAQGLCTCSLFISFTLIFALTTFFLASLSVCLFLTLFICLPECLFNSIAPFVCLMLSVSLMVCLSASRSFCLSSLLFWQAELLSVLWNWEII